MCVMYQSLSCLLMGTPLWRKPSLMGCVLQVHRLQLFDVVMQFRAIFSDDSSAQETVAGASSVIGTESRDGGAVYSWAQHRL